MNHHIKSFKMGLSRAFFGEPPQRFATCNMGWVVPCVLGPTYLPKIILISFFNRIILISKRDVRIPNILQENEKHK